MAYEYSDPTREAEQTALPDIEVFHMTAKDVAATMEDQQVFDAIVDGLGITGGWFWRACFPGCLPDSEPIGPFTSYADALEDAQSSDE